MLARNRASAASPSVSTNFQVPLRKGASSATLAASSFNNAPETNSRLASFKPAGHQNHDGGLISYGPDTIEPYVRAAGYVDRIFKGEKPANLPAQAPTKYRLAVNLKTAKALGLTVSPSPPRRRGD
jgi:ABC transporter substrate binding protein